MPKALATILYPLLFIFSFLFFIYWMLPMSAIKSRIIGGVESQLGPGFEIKIGEVKTSWLTGVKITDFAIFNMESGKASPWLQAQSLKVHVGLFSLLFGSPKISFDAKMDKARVEGVLHKSDQGFSFEGSFNHFDLNQIPALRALSGLHLTSEMEGKISVDYDAKQPLRTVGNIDVTIDRLMLKASELSLGEMGSFPLPDLDVSGAGSLVKASISKGAMQMDALRLKGGDLTLELTGKIFLAPVVSHYRMNLQGNFQFSQKLWGLLDPILPGQWLEELKKQKGANDNFPLSISGQFASPQIYSGTVAIYPFKPF